MYKSRMTINLSKVCRNKAPGKLVFRSNYSGRRAFTVSIEHNSSIRTAYVIGSATIDFVGSGVVTYGTSNPGKVSYNYGGVSRNVAETLVRLSDGNLRVCLVSSVGNDINGRALVESCRALGICTDLMKTVENERTASFLALLGKNNDLIAGVADMQICDTISPELFAFEPRKQDFIVLDGNLTESAISDFCSIALQARIRVAFEPVSVAKSVKIASYLQYIHFIKPNYDELLAIHRAHFENCKYICEGEKEPNLEKVKSYCHQLLDIMKSRGSHDEKAIAVTLGAKGGFLLVSDIHNVKKEFEISPITMNSNSIVSTIGAGDSFFGAYKYGRWYQELEHEKALVLANKVVELCLLSPSTVSSSLSSTSLV